MTITYRDAVVLKQHNELVLLEIKGFGRKVIDIQLPSRKVEIGRKFVAVMKDHKFIGTRPDWLGKYILGEQQ